MLYFVSAELALGYWLFAFFSTLGALQWVATRYGLVGLAFLSPEAGYGASRSRTWGYMVAAFLVVGSAAGFLVSQWEAIFAPGPAGSELAVLFGTSATCALASTLIIAPVLERWRRGTGPGVGGGIDPGQSVTVGHATGQLYVPPGPIAAAPAVCLLPACPVGTGCTLDAATGRGTSPADGGRNSRPRSARTTEVRSMAMLARRLAAEGVVALVVNPDAQSYAYPAILATLPAAVALLRERPEVDPNRIGALGEDLGGDLVIRAASTSKEIRAVAALAPVLVQVPPGFGLLREMSYGRAMRWARDRGRATLCKELNATEYGARIPPRPFLLLYGEEDDLVGEAPLANWGLSDGKSVGQDSGQLQVIPGLGHMDLASHPAVMRIVSVWLQEHL